MRKIFSVKSRGLFDPASDKPFKVSRSRIESFLECPFGIHLAWEGRLAEVSAQLLMQCSV